MEQLAARLAAANLRFWFEGDELVIRGPRDCIGDELRAQIREGKASLRQLLPEGARVSRLSLAQQRLWFFHQMMPGHPVYNVPVALWLDGPLDQTRLERALARLIGRHEALRTTFAEFEGEAVQVVHPASALCMEVTPLEHLPRAVWENEVQRWAEEEARRPFDLERGPLFRAHLLRLGADTHALLLNMHHIITDGWSVSLLLRDLFSLYEADGGFPELRGEPASYAEFALSQRRAQEAQGSASLDYWVARLQELPPTLDLCLDRVRPPIFRHAGAEHPFHVGPETLNRLKALARAHSATLFMVLAAALKLLLMRYSGRTDICIGTVAGNRATEALKDTVGFFVNTLALRTELSGAQDFKTVLARVRETTLGAYEHQETPFTRVIEAVSPPRSPGMTPLFQVACVLQNLPKHGRQFAGIEARRFHVDVGVALFDLSFVLEEREEGLSGRLQYNTDLFVPSSAERMARQFAHLLNEIAEAPESALRELHLEPPQVTRERIAGTLLHRAVPRAASLQAMLQEIVERQPGETAIVHEGGVLSYGELWAMASSIAAALQARGLKPDSVLGVCLDRGPAAVAAWIAALRCGAAFLPVEPSFPLSRIRTMLEDTNPAWVLTSEHLRANLPHTHPQVCIETLDLWSAPGPVREARGKVSYIIYTSGSTGQPKGAALPAEGLQLLAEWQRAVFSLGTGQRVLQFSSLSFDSFLFECCAALCSGAALCIPSWETRLSPEHLGRYLDEHQITLAAMPPSMWTLLPEATLPSLRHVLMCGESIPISLLERRSRSRSVCNGYGPSEVTICTSIEFNADAARPNVIGRPVPFIRAYVVDESGALLPPGVAGELLLGGPGVAFGYINRPELTREAFIEDPFLAGGGRVYRTGDLVRWLDDGRLEFLGRRDTQVKIRGLRIELGEIEAALRALPEVLQAAVLADAAGTEMRICAHLVLSGNAIPDPGALRAQLRRRLPDFMIPASFEVHEQLPMLPSGKIDLMSLRKVQADRDPQPPLDAPASELEKIIATVFEHVLGCKRVGRHDDFFALGGHSLKLARAAALIGARAGIDVPAKRLFNAPTPATLAARLASAKTSDSDDACATAEQGAWAGKAVL